MIEYVYDDTGNIEEVRRTTVSPFEIFGFQPTRAAPGTVVTIQGQGFSPTPTENQVTAPRYPHGRVRSQEDHGSVCLSHQFLIGRRTDRA